MAIRAKTIPRKGQTPKAGSAPAPPTRKSLPGRAASPFRSGCRDKDRASPCRCGVCGCSPAHGTRGAAVPLCAPPPRLCSCPRPEMSRMICVWALHETRHALGSGSCSSQPPALEISFAASSGQPESERSLVHQHRATRLLSWGQNAPSVNKAPSDRPKIKFRSQITHFSATSPSGLSPPRRDGSGQPIPAALGMDAAVPVLFRLRLFSDRRPCLSARPDPLQTGGSCSCGEERGGRRF